jgi:retron-type reverse transcriptase
MRALILGTGLPEREIRRIILTAPMRYKVYKIAKRHGGFREIAQPAREVKALQRVLEREFLSKLPVHPAAMAYRKGRSIRDNALTHVENGPILKMDFREFFPSIRPHDWHAYCDDRGIFHDPDERAITTNILFFRKKGSIVTRLAIGAPSSPHLSNLLMYAFDALVTEKVAKDFVTYTRYADDLTFSAKRTGYLTVVQRAVRESIKEVPWPKLTINESKTVVATTKYHRQVTGLVLTNDQTVSIGHKRKRNLRAAVHRASLGQLTAEEMGRLAGFLAFVNAVEPDFLVRLEKKFGSEVLQLVKKNSATIEM